MAKTILVSNRLPVRIGAGGELERTTGGLASALSGAGVDAQWVGWPGVPVEALTDPDRITERLLALGVAPVMLDQHELDTYYEGYANATLWPVLHSMVTRAVFRADWFEVYRAVNRSFSEIVLALAEPGDTVWIHDFHLFLLPELLREADRGLRIGFFLHTPFPGSELFRALPEREALLRGLLGADRIGFHTFGYLRHFRSSLLRVLGLESDMDGVRCSGHTARLGVHPIGHDQDSFSKALSTPGFGEALAAHANGLNGRQLVLGVERLDYTKGVPQKLEVVRKFLQEYPEWRRRVLFLVIAVPSRQGIREYDELTEEVQRTVGALNGEFGALGHVPIEFLHQSFPQVELAALYALADVCVVTPLIDGMNLVAKEFVACKFGVPEARPGALVLSEFAGAAAEMSDALLVNPYDSGAVVEALVEALEMSADERRRRVRAMGPRIQRHDAAAWAAGFLGALRTSRAPEADATGLPSLAGLDQEWSVQLARGARATLMLDYDGTLRAFTQDPNAAVPDARLRGLLADLARHAGVTVVVISGRPKDFRLSCLFRDGSGAHFPHRPPSRSMAGPQQNGPWRGLTADSGPSMVSGTTRARPGALRGSWLTGCAGPGDASKGGDRLPRGLSCCPGPSGPFWGVPKEAGEPDFLDEHLSGLGLRLVAEHGFRWRLADDTPFELVQPGLDLGWKDSVLPLLQQAVDLTPGSSLEVKASSLVWHYRRADPEFGVWRAHLLLTELTDVSVNLPIVVHHGKKIVEVASQFISKGRAMAELLEREPTELVLAAGDDQTDESMFALRGTVPGCGEHGFVSVKVGDGPTRAERRTDCEGLLTFLESLAAHTRADS